MRQSSRHVSTETQPLGGRSPWPALCRYLLSSVAVALFCLGFVCVFVWFGLDLGVFLAF